MPHFTHVDYNLRFLSSVRPGTDFRGKISPFVLSHMGTSMTRHMRDKEAVNIQRILDACCGSKMFWFDKQNSDVLYMDNRQFSDRLCDGRKLEVNPSVVADFRNMPFADNSFYLVVFDPPHLLKAGENSWLAKKYGKLGHDWKEDIAQGFRECMRVLKPNGTLIFKWNEEQIALKDVVNAIGLKPLFGNRRSKTHWLVFMK